MPDQSWFDKENWEGLKVGLKLYNEQDFFECHEVLEDLWIESPNDALKNLYWFILQTATAMHHYENSNLTGMKGQLMKAQKKYHFLCDLNLEFRVVDQYTNFSSFISVFKNAIQNLESEPLKSLYHFKFEV